MADLRFKLLNWQMKEFKKNPRFSVIMAGRRCGKTSGAIKKALIKGIECPDKTAGVAYVAPTQAMARRLAWNAILEQGKSIIRSVSNTHMEVTLINGVTIYVAGADKPDNLRGLKLYFVVLDEIKDFKPDVWPMVIRPALTDMKGGAMFIGTPEPGDNQFNDLFDYAESGVDKDWTATLLTTYDNETIDRDEIETAKRTLSTAVFEQEYMANRFTSGANLLKMEWFKHGPDPREGDYYITIDPAGFESVIDPKKKKHLDNFAIAIVKVTPTGKWWVHKIDYGRWDVREASVRVMMAIRTFKPLSIGIERGSLARAFLPYFTDLMRKNNMVYPNIKPISTSGSSKINRISYALQGMMEHGRIEFNVNENWDQFRREMIAFPSPRTHDDLLDSLSMIAHLVTVPYGGNRNNDDYNYIVMDEICGF